MLRGQDRRNQQFLALDPEDKIGPAFTASEFEGGDDWIREQFKNYLTRIVLVFTFAFTTCCAAYLP